MTNAETIKYLQCEAKKHGLTFRKLLYVRFDKAPAYDFVPRGSALDFYITAQTLVNALNNWESGYILERNNYKDTRPK